MTTPKPITTPVRKLGWEPTRTPRMPGGTLEFTDDQYRKGLFAYGKRHDYCIRMDGDTAHVGQWHFEALLTAEPDPLQALSYAILPNATTNDAILQAEIWEHEND